MLSHHSSTFVPYTTLFRSQASFWRICFANPRLVQSSKAHIHNCGLHRALSELSLKRDRALAKAYSKSPLRLSRCNYCGISVSFRHDFGDFCSARQKLLAKRVCEANRAKQPLPLGTLAVSQNKSPRKPSETALDLRILRQQNRALALDTWRRARKSPAAGAAKRPLFRSIRFPAP